MKKLYWRPHKVSRGELVLVLGVAILGMLAVERLPQTRERPWYAEKLAAAQLARQGMETLRAHRLELGPLDAEVDPAHSGMIGELVSEVTSNKGSLEAKQTSVNPNFAAVVVEYLKELGVSRGDLVAVGVSGSFPAFNVSVYSALETLGIDYVPIASASSSQWGANRPDWLWIDMERLLVERGLLRHRSVAASLGAIKDRGQGLSNEGRALLREGIARNGLELIEEAALPASVDRRMAIYERHAAGRRYKAFINIGGGAAVVGTHVGKKLYVPGLNRQPPRGAGQVDSVMNRFAFAGVPIIHLVQVAQLAKANGFPNSPAAVPPPGQGRVFVERGYNKWLAAGVAVGLLLFLIAIIRTDWGFRLMQLAGRPEERRPPEQMV